MKRWQAGLLILVALVAIVGSYLWWQIRSLEVEYLNEDLFVLRGLGGNTAVLKTDAGLIIVDTMTLPAQGKRIRETAETLTGMKTLLLINTHYHLDHTHGNPAFDPGTRVVATDRTLSHLKALDADFWSGDAAKLLPNETFSDRDTLRIGGKTVVLVHPGPGHTDGDLVVMFTDEKTIHMGDLLFNNFYPNIDLEAGGSVQKWPNTLDQVLAMDFDRVIPGHGLTTDRSGILQFRTFMAQLGDIGRRAAETGLTLEQVVASDQLTEDEGYEAIRFVIPLGLDREFVLRRAWEEATGSFTVAN